MRTCNEIVGRGTLDFIDRGIGTVIGTFANKPFIESTCESCGECVVRCPVGALAPKVPKFAAREVQTTCVYCGVGCGIYLGVAGDKVVNVRADRERPTNEGSLCVKGRYGFNFINHSDRLTKPLIKKNGEFAEAEWDEALELVASKFAETQGRAIRRSGECQMHERRELPDPEVYARSDGDEYRRPLRETLTQSHGGRSGHHLRFWRNDQLHQGN